MKINKASRRSNDNTETMPNTTGRDPIKMLFDQDQTRLPDLVPIRHQRMSESPFAFYRGSAKIMAYDLAQQDAETPNSGLTVQACGDAHLANFGVYATPERRLVFDVNDFDETLPGPWEWDVKRLAASGVIAAQHNGISPKKQRKAAAAAAQGYLEAMKIFSEMGYRETWDASIDVDILKEMAGTSKESARIEKQSNKAKRRDTMQALQKLTERDENGGLRIKSDPPLVVPIRDFESQLDQGEAARRIKAVFTQYHESLPDHVSSLLSRYEPIDMAIKVVGVGSVGTFCFIGLFKGKDDSDPLFLQVKEATDSVLAEHVGASKYENAGERVVQGQRLIQSSSDMFLGWARSPENRDFYWRQLRDWKWSPNLETMRFKRLESFMRLCGWTLAHGHARSGDATAISNFLDSQLDFPEQIAQFGIDYSKQNLADYELFCAAIDAEK